MSSEFSNQTDFARIVERFKSLPEGARVFVHGAAATPTELLELFVESRRGLPSVEMIHLHTMGPCPWTAPDTRGAIRTANLFVGDHIRAHFDNDVVDYLPCFLSEIPALFRSKRRKIDLALVQVSPPSDQGLCSLGVSVDVARAAVDVATEVIALINPKMPSIGGDGMIPSDRLSARLQVSRPIHAAQWPEPTEVDRAIGKYVAGLVEDGATLQVGIGAIPNAVLTELKDRKHLGIHTEMWSDGMLELIRAGVVDNSKKKVHPGKTVSSFLMGSSELYDFVNANSSVLQLEASFVNDPRVIATNPDVVAINSAVEVDLTGQVCADSIGHRIISGVGGQMDFIRGASLSERGRPVIALPSRTKSGRSKIVATLKSGAGVVTTRAHVHYVATEFGLVDLYGKTLSERARALISIAHPEDRESLEREWFLVRRSK